MNGAWASAKTMGHKARIILRYAMLICISVILLFPLVYMLAGSFTDRAEVAENYAVVSGADIQADTEIKSVGFRLIPEKASLMQYYNVLLRRPRFLDYFWNSVRMTVPIMLGQMVVSLLAAYAFAKLRFPFRDKLFFAYIIVMLMPFQVTLVPNYIMLRDTNLLGSYWAVILPGMFTTFGVFLLRQFIRQIPDEYCEAARIDGAGYLRTLTNVILPQCKGAMASLGILVFVDNWNMVEQPLIFLKDESMHPLSIFLSRINEGEIGIAFACGILFMLPALLIFLYGENYFVEGIQLSGIK
jgi:multiple sugar transport system permease protein